LIPGIHDGEYDSLEQRSDLIEFEWEITQALLNMQYAGAIEFAVYILLEGEKTTIWKSNINSELYTGETIMLTGEGDIQPETGEIVLVNGENLDKKLDELLGPDEMEKSGATSTTDAIIYAIERLIGSEFIFDAGDASEFIQSEE
jgi:hypothetical protein